MLTLNNFIKNTTAKWFTLCDLLFFIIKYKKRDRVLSSVFRVTYEQRI